MRKAFGFAYGLVVYALFLAVFLYLVAFIGDFVVPRTIDSGPSTSLGVALAVNLGLLLLFAVRLEERDLLRFHGEDYRSYRERVRMLVPLQK